MGHYDEQREESQRTRTDATKQRAELEARRLGVKLMTSTTFRVVGVCESCAKPIRSIPNWGCREDVCPHRP